MDKVSRSVEIGLESVQLFDLLIAIVVGFVFIDMA